MAKAIFCVHIANYTDEDLHVRDLTPHSLAY